MNYGSCCIFSSLCNISSLFSIKLPSELPLTIHTRSTDFLTHSNAKKRELQHKPLFVFFFLFNGSAPRTQEHYSFDKDTSHVLLSFSPLTLSKSPKTMLALEVETRQFGQCVVNGSCKQLFKPKCFLALELRLGNFLTLKIGHAT